MITATFRDDFKRDVIHQIVERGNPVAEVSRRQGVRALREPGQFERSLFMIEWYSIRALLRRYQVGLSKREAAHKLKGSVFFHERDEIRDRSFEIYAFRASGLNLFVSVIVHWNTIYLHLGQLPASSGRFSVAQTLGLGTLGCMTFTFRSTLACRWELVLLRLPII